MESNQTITAILQTIPSLGRFVATCCAALTITCSVHSEIFVIKHNDGSITFASHPPYAGESGTLFVPRPIGFKTTKNIWDEPPVIRARYSFSPNSYDTFISSYSKDNGIDPALVKAVIHAESAFNPRAISAKGAQGLMQLMPPTARSVGVKNALEPKQNIRGGVLYLKQLLEKYQGNLSLTIAAYNAGPNVVDSYNGIPPYKETRAYVKKVLALHKSYKESLS